MINNAKIKIGLAALLFFCGSQAIAQKGEYRLKGSIEGASGVIYLVHTDSGNKEVKDSAKVVNGKFQFKGRVAEPKFYELSSKFLKYPIRLLMENSEIFVTKTKDSLAQAVIEGSDAHNVYSGFYSGPWKKITSIAGDIYQRMDKANQKGKVTLDSTTRAGFDREFRSLDTLNQLAVHAYVAQHPSSAGSAAVIYDRFISYFNSKIASSIFELLSKDVQQSFLGREITKALAVDAKTAKGKLAPPIMMADKDGKIVRLSDFKGKYVLIDFWASWCGPCRKENPNVVAAYRKFHDKGFEILGISLDSKRDAWLKAIEADGLTWTHVSELKGWTNTAATDYGVKAVPASFLLDPEGKVVGKDLRGEDLHNALAECLK